MLWYAYKDTQKMVEDSIADWFRSIPKITRWWFSLSILIPFLVRFGLLYKGWLILLYDPLVYHFQIWRLVTAFFYFPINPLTGFMYLMNMYFLYSYSRRLETGIFTGRPADYLFMLIFSGVIIIILGLLLELEELMVPLSMAAMYFWCQLNRDAVLTFWFGIQLKAMYMPWLILLLNYILNGNLMHHLVGNLTGHLYFFVMFKYPQDFGGQVLLSTPQILYDYLPNERGVMGGFGHVPQPRQNQQDRGAHVWGTGNALGDN